MKRDEERPGVGMAARWRSEDEFGDQPASPNRKSYHQSPKSALKLEVSLGHMTKGIAGGQKVYIIYVCTKNMTTNY